MKVNGIDITKEVLENYKGYSMSPAEIVCLIYKILGKIDAKNM